MENKKAFLAMTAVVNKENMAEVPIYLGNVMPVFAKNGGKPIGRFKTIDNLSGNDSPEMIGIIQFSNSEVIKKLIQSKDFLALSESRTKAFKKLNMMICAEI
jgi:uncharacterized protein (DUF1330 family)